MDDIVALWAYFLFKHFIFKFITVCLAIPGKIKSVNKKTNIASVDFDGIERDVNISLVEAEKGDYVIVHAGFAIQKLTRRDAKEVLVLLDEGKDIKG